VGGDVALAIVPLVVGLLATLVALRRRSTLTAAVSRQAVRAQVTM
jgi:hypothetical protein